MGKSWALNRMGAKKIRNARMQGSFMISHFNWAEKLQNSLSVINDFDHYSDNLTAEKGERRDFAKKSLHLRG
jgi:hypothetical protein